jgi:leucyl aminopeptidase (aminopeptidase T)
LGDHPVISLLEEISSVRRSKISQNIKVNQTRWVYTRKPSPQLYKARLSLRGDLETTEFKPEDTFSTVVRTENLSQRNQEQDMGTHE